MKVAKFTKVSQDYGNIDDLPLPDWTVFDLKGMVDTCSSATRVLYRYSRPNPRPFIIYTARGCPFNCSFCVHDGNRIYRPRSIENVMHEIGLMYKEYNFNILIIQDELFAVNKERLREFCETLLENKKKHGWDFDWMFQTHASAKLDLGTLKLAKKAGCFFFSYGLESASQAVLDSMNKKSSPAQIEEAIRFANEAGIGFAGNLLWGDMAETEDTIRETLDFYFKYIKENFIFPSLVSPYPGSKLFDICIQRGVIGDKTEFYEHIDTFPRNMTAMPDRIWRSWIQYLHFLSQNNHMLVGATTATHYQELPDKDMVSAYHRQKFWKIWAKCPNCGAEMCYRELASGLDGERTMDMIAVGCTNCGRFIRVNLTDAIQKRTD